MRPSQQKNRMRGRGRKQPNPMSRNFESNGPDVKIRGNAAHVAEKYMTLARDASSSGDRVMAENYLQHAEHYNRIVAAAAANSVRNDEQAGSGRGPQPEVSNESNEESGRTDATGELQPKREGRNPRQSNNNRNRARPANRANDNDDAGNENTDSSNKSETGAAESDGNEVAVTRPSRGRGRRPRVSETSSANGQSEGGAVETGDGMEEEKAVAVKSDISSDAAKLPGGLLGVGAESSPASNPDNDD